MQEDQIKIAAVGDVSFGDHLLCLGFGVRSTIEKMGSDFIFEHVRDLFQDSNIVFGNLEGVLSDSNLASGAADSMVFRGKPEAVACLASAGFDVVNVANNHTMQHGLAAFVETVDLLRNSGIEPVGLAGNKLFSSQPVIKEEKGYRIGILAYSFLERQWGEQNPPYAVGRRESVCEDVRRLKEQTDYVIVSCHWGRELMKHPSPRSVSLAHEISRAGADVILGHHPHTFQSIERYRNSLIFYSLGTCVSDFLWSGESLDSAIITLSLGSVGKIGYDAVPVRINTRYQPKPMSQKDAQRFIEQFANARIEDWDARSPEEMQRACSQYSMEAERLNKKLNAEKIKFVLRNFYRLKGATISALCSKSITKILNCFPSARVEESRQVDDDRPTGDDSALQPEARCSGAESSSAEAKKSGTPLPRILHVIHWPRSGITSFLAEYLRGIENPKFRYHVLLFVHGQEDLTAFEALCDSAHCLHFDENRLRGLLKYRRIIRDLSPDIIHTHSFQPGVWARLFALGTSARLVSTIHSPYPYFLKRGLFDRFKAAVEIRSIGMKNDRVICVSDAVREHLTNHTRIDNRLLEVVRNGIDTVPRDIEPDQLARAREEIACNGSQKVITTVGRLSGEKGIDILLSAFSAVLERTGDVVLVIIGSGELERILKVQAGNLGISDHVRFLGFKSDVLPYLALSNLYVSASRFEGLPMSLVEALSIGVPVIATSVGGIPEIIQDQATGVLVEPERPDTLANAMLEVLKNDILAERFRKCGRQRVKEHFNIERTICSYEDIYMKCLSGEKSVR